MVTLGCGGGGAGDPAPEVKGSVLGDGHTLASLNDPKNPRPLPSEILQITGLRVTVLDTYDETKSGAIGNIYLQDFTDPPVAYQGVLAFQSSYSPPSFRVAVGDVVDAAGQYSEFQANLDFLKKDRPGWTTPELNGANLELRFDAPYRPLVPVEIKVADLLAYETGRPWLSMLVTIRNVKITDNVKVDGNNRASVTMDVGGGIAVKDIPTITNELFDLVAFNTGPDGTETRLTNGTELESVTGVVTLFDRFHIAPRTAEDIKLR